MKILRSFPQSCQNNQLHVDTLFAQILHIFEKLYTIFRISSQSTFGQLIISIGQLFVWTFGRLFYPSHHRLPSPTLSTVPESLTFETPFLILLSATRQLFGDCFFVSS